MTNYLSDVGPPQRVCEWTKPAERVNVTELILKELKELKKEKEKCVKHVSLQGHKK